MPLLLFAVGTLALVAGLAMVGFGIPINEFSFGNTLISAGTTAIVGGLIIIALAATVSQLRRMMDVIAARSPDRVPVPDGVDTAADYEPPASSRAAATTRSSRLVPTAGRPSPVEPPEEMIAESEQAETLGPTLRNPAQTDERFAAYSSKPAEMPAQARAGAAGGFASRAPAASTLRDTRSAATHGAPPSPPIEHAMSAPQPAKFDAMWPAQAKARRDVPPATGSEPSSSETFARRPKPVEQEPQKSRTVAVLKSGVVDGMSYTLYVDGSIEAELPQGTVRFASISELRSHLEKKF